MDRGRQFQNPKFFGQKKVIAGPWSGSSASPSFVQTDLPIAPHSSLRKLEGSKNESLPEPVVHDNQLDLFSERTALDHAFLRVRKTGDGLSPSYKPKLGQYHEKNIGGL